MQTQSMAASTSSIHRVSTQLRRPARARSSRVAARLPRSDRNLYQDWFVAENRRRPQWRGERKAVLVRLPVEVADQLAKAAEVSQLSVSEAASRYIAIALTSTPSGGDAR